MLQLVITVVIVAVGCWLLATKFFWKRETPEEIQARKESMDQKSSNKNKPKK